MAPILVMGLGNMLLQDEGLGVRALRRLTERYILPDDVEVIDAGALGLSLLSFLEGVEDVLIIDAIHRGQRPGSLIRLEGEEVALAETLHLLPQDGPSARVDRPSWRGGFITAADRAVGDGTGNLRTGAGTDP